MKLNKLFLLFSVLFLQACVAHSPAPTAAGYSSAIENLSAAQNAKYVVTSNWYPNVLLGSVDSFHASSTHGKLFITPDRLVFAVYDSATKSYLQSYDISYSKITWLTAKEHGRGRIIRLQANNTINSFLFSNGVKPDGHTAHKDEITNYLLEKFK